MVFLAEGMAVQKVDSSSLVALVITKYLSLVNDPET